METVVMILFVGLCVTMFGAIAYGLWDLLKIIKMITEHHK